MSGSQVEGQEEEAGPAAAAAAAGWDDDADQRREEGQPHVRHLWRIQQPFRGQDGPGGAAVEGKPARLCVREVLKEYKGAAR